MARRPQDQEPESPQPNEDPDQDLMVGGPGQEAPPETEPDDEPSGDAPPDLVRVKLNGQDLEVTPEVAEAIQAREDEFRRRMGERSNDLGELRGFREKFNQLFSGQDQSTQQPTPIHQLLFEDPEAAIQLLEENITNKLTGAYQQQRAQDLFWSDFYGENPDLKGEDTLVQGVLNRHMDRLADLRGSMARSQLADLTRKEILRLSRKAKSGGDGEDISGQNGRQFSESGGQRRAPRRPAADEDDAPKTLGESIRRNRQRKKAAAAKT